MTDRPWASALDSTLIPFFWGTMFGVLQGAAICKAAGLPLEIYRRSLEGMTSPMGGMAIDLLSRVGRENFSGDQATLKTHAVFLDHLLETCRDHGIDRSLLNAFHRLFTKAIEAGNGGDDLSVLSKHMLESPSTVS